MIDDTQTQLSNEAAHPLLLDLLSDRKLNAELQKHSALENIRIEIKISQPQKELLRLIKSGFAKCPCNNQHPEGNCLHSVDNAGNAICSM